MDEQQIRSLAQQFIDALHALEQGHDDAVETIAALFSPDARLTNAALELSGAERTGIEGAQSFWTQYRDTLGSVFSEFFQITVNEHAAGLFWTSKGADQQGKPLEYDGASLLVFDDTGKISLFRGYYDTRQLDRKVGANG